MEELFRSILGLFIISFPILALIGRRQRTARERAEKTDAAARSDERVSRGDLETSASRADLLRSDPLSAEPGSNRPGSASQGSDAPGGPRAGPGSQVLPEVTTVDTSAARPHWGGRARGIGEPALARIEGLPRMQQAYVWSQVFGRPKALRRTPDPWDE